MRVEPLTGALWPAFEELMADSGGPAARCWCMAWRLTGDVSTFLRAGFTEVARRSPERPILRLLP